MEASQISAGLNSPFWRITLPAPLEREFESGTVVKRNRYLAGWLGFALALNIFYLGFDVLSGALLGSPVVVVHIGVCLLLVLAAPVLVAQPPRWAVSVIVVGVHLVDLAAATWIGLHAPEPFADRVITTTGFMVLVVNVTSPLRFRDAVLLSVLSVSAFGWLLLGPADRLGVPQWDNVLNAGVMALISLGIVHRRERVSRLTFLLGVLDKLRLREVAAMSETDVLTALPNRRAFDSTLETQWGMTRETGELLGLLMIDVDYFKQLNDLRGHAEGDRCLRNVAALMRSVVRPGSDMIARYGGEEFAVVLRDVDQGVALEIAERLRGQVEEAALPHPAHGVVTVSVGSALARPASCNGGAETLVEAADKALYEAKQAGRNRVAMAPGGEPARAEGVSAAK